MTGPRLRGLLPSTEGTLARCPETLRANELAERLHWFIHTRWIAVLLCLAGMVWALHPPWSHAFGLHVDYRFFLTVTLCLAGTNLIYGRVARQAEQPVPRPLLHRLLRAQVLTDFLNLALLSYGLGGIETPILILFMPHIILSTLFFTRIQSLAMTLAAILCATLPMVLEAAGIIPTVSIVAAGHKALPIGASPVITAGYALAIAGAFLVCWYLVSAITFSLRLRECQLEEAFAQLQLLDQEKSRVTLRATHELKAPFAAIKSYVYALRDGYCGPLPDPARQVVLRIGERCDRLMDKITGIIHLSNLRSASPRTRELTALDLQPLLAREVQEAQLPATPRHITLRLQDAAAPCPILATEELIHTLLSNLLTNAVIYSHDGGAIDVGLEEEPNGWIALWVQDQGIGIPEDQLDRIFTEHFRSNNAVQHNPNGNGLGLALARETVRLLGARIAVQSRPGQGSRFSVHFRHVSGHTEILGPPR
ncbi:MAG: HAMP domain-containing histidine kinase [Magnetococcales bacterium]|nr:HAMP domain-containing histidine kinase [Magnetococcales bacterium]